MNNKFLDKVYDQILSETRIDDRIHTPFSYPLPFIDVTISEYFYKLFFKHCKEIYTLKNEQEIEYVWDKYKEGLTTLMEDKEPAHQEKRMMIYNPESEHSIIWTIKHGLIT